MIGWLNGRAIHCWNQSQRTGLVISCAGVGYEVQVLPRQIENLHTDQDLSIWVHQVQREDSSSLFGFETDTERNLFRKLIAINGIGPQIGMSLLNDFSAEELVLAIINKDTVSLTKSQGVGKRVAERLAIELSNKLDEFVSVENSERNKTIANTSDLDDTYEKKITDIKQTLEGIGYEKTEIDKAIKGLSIDSIDKDPLLSSSLDYIKNTSLEKLMKEILVRLSQDNPTNGA